jgi:competence protein ComEA
VDEKGLSRVNKSLLIGIAVGGIVGVIGAVLVMVLSRPIRPAAIEIRMPEPTAELPPTDMPLPTATPGLLHVYVTGEVVAADVYELPPGSLVKDAIVMAGGFSEEANEAAVNLALSLRDADHIHVPAMDETAVIPPVSSGGLSPTVIEVVVPIGLVNINTASLEELDTLPGIGPAIAQDIIDYRELNGPFETIEDIMKVSGIGPAKFEAIRELVTVR